MLLSSIAIWVRRAWKWGRVLFGRASHKRQAAPAQTDRPGIACSDPPLFDSGWTYNNSLDTGPCVLKIVSPGGMRGFLFFVGSENENKTRTLLLVDDPHEALKFNSRTAALSLLCAIHHEGDTVPCESSTVTE